MCPAYGATGGGPAGTPGYLFLPAPAHGHVNPTLAVAAELVARGHEVTYLLPGEFRAAVTATGAALVEHDVRSMEPPNTGDGAPNIGMVLDLLSSIAEELADPVGCGLGPWARRLFNGLIGRGAIAALPSEGAAEGEGAAEAAGQYQVEQERW